VITVLVAASSEVVRAGLAALLASSSRLTVSGLANGWADLTERADAVQPNVVLIEAGSRGEDVAAQVVAFVAGGGSPPLVLLVDEASVNLLKAGARGVLPAGVGATEIVAAIEAVAAGLVVLHPEALEPALSVEGGLSSREVEVLRMLAEGLANKEIAYRLGLSEHTVKFHIAAIFGKLHVSSRTEAVTTGIRQGLILL
jgi:two-component system, NarL family, response regulator YdfI